MRIEEAQTRHLNSTMSVDAGEWEEMHSNDLPEGTFAVPRNGETKLGRLADKSAQIGS